MFWIFVALNQKGLLKLLIGKKHSHIAKLVKSLEKSFTNQNNFVLKNLLQITYDLRKVSVWPIWQNLKYENVFLGIRTNLQSFAKTLVHMQKLCKTFFSCKEGLHSSSPCWVIYWSLHLFDYDKHIPWSPWLSYK